MKLNTKIATETAIDDVIPETQKLFDESADKPQFSPKEIAAIYPNLRLDNYRQALLRIANASKTPRGSHLANVVKFINMVRPLDDYNDCYPVLVNLFRGATRADLRDYLVDILTLWCIPSPVRKQVAEVLLGDSSRTYPYEAEIHQNAGNWTVEKLEKKGREYLKRLSEVKKMYRAKPSLQAEEEIEELELALCVIDSVQAILGKDYYSLWDTVRDYGFTNDADAAPRVVELIKAYAVK